MLTRSQHNVGRSFHFPAKGTSAQRLIIRYNRGHGLSEWMSTLEVFCAEHIITHHWFVVECSSCHRLTDLCHELQTIKLGVRVVCEDSEMNIGYISTCQHKANDRTSRQKRACQCQGCTVRKTQLSDSFHRATTAVVNPEITVVTSRPYFSQVPNLVEIIVSLQQCCANGSN